MAVTTDDVLALTLVVVGDEHIVVAENVLRMATGVAPTASLSTTDQFWFDKAVGYQAAFVALQPGMFATLDVETESLDGHSIGYWKDRLAALIAPMARAALGNAITIDVGDGRLPEASFPAAAEPPGDWEDALWGGPVA